MNFRFPHRADRALSFILAVFSSCVLVSHDSSAQSTTETAAGSQQLLHAPALTTPTSSLRDLAHERQYYDLKLTEKLAKILPADDYRESTAAKAVLHHDLETTVTGASGQTSPSLTARFISTLETLSGPLGRQPSGSLSGKLIFCSGGHGWTCDTTSGLWYTQRPLTFGMVEDFGNVDQNNLFADICFRAGATVVPFRPLGHQVHERIVDNMQQACVRFQGQWYDSQSDVFYGTLRDRVPYRFARASRQETAIARFHPYLPERGTYPVYCWARDGADRVLQTYRIVHSGGATDVRVNHRMVGKGWVYLGQYAFERGTSGYVEVTNLVDDAKDVGGVVVADAIRFGNGMGDVNRGGGISRRPREEEACAYWVKRAAEELLAPVFELVEASDQDNNVGSSPRMAAHMNREKEGTFFDRIFLSFHSNAVGGRGVVGLFDNDAHFRPDLQKEYAEMLARQYNEDMTTTGGLALPFPWAVHKKLTDSHINFGEIRRDYINNEMTATISEVAYHDNPLDARLLEMPSVRIASAMACYKTILRFFRQYDPKHPGFTLLPDTPEVLSARWENGGATVSWAAPKPNPIGGAAPVSYRVYHSTNGSGFDGGINAGNRLTMRFDQLSTDSVHYFRVSAENKGGESAPSRILGTSGKNGSVGRVLVISAFSSLSEDLNLSQTATANLGMMPPREGGEFVRIIPRLMNPGDQVVAAADALTTSGRDLDSCTFEGVTSGGLTLDSYAAVVLMLGREPHGGRLFETPQAAAIADYVSRGGRLLVSGSDLSGIRSQEARRGNAARLFAGLRPAGTVSCSEGVVGRSGSLLSTATLHLDNGWDPDFKLPVCMALDRWARRAVLMNWGSPEGKPAAFWLDWRNGRAIAFAFPFELIRGKETQADILARTLKLLRTPAGLSRR